MTKNKIICTLMLCTLVVACANPSDPNRKGGISKQDAGGLGGALLGGIAGSQIGKGKGSVAGAVVGALFGAYAGSEIGASLDERDRMYANQTAQHAFEYGHTNEVSMWRNPDSGNSGSIIPTRTVESNGQVCREYTQDIHVGGKTETAVGKACRTGDGTWRIVSQ